MSLEHMSTLPPPFLGKEEKPNFSNVDKVPMGREGDGPGILLDY